MMPPQCIVALLGQREYLQPYVAEQHIHESNICDLPDTTTQPAACIAEYHPLLGHSTDGPT